MAATGFESVGQKGQERVGVTKASEVWRTATTTDNNTIVYRGKVSSDIWAELEALKSKLDPRQAFRKCTHCGQWGAVMLPCGHCGAPIDPEE